MITFDRAELIPAPLRLLIENFVGTARKFAREGKELAAMAWVGDAIRGQVAMVPIFTARDSADAAAMMREAAKALDASFIFQIQETWAIDLKASRAEYEALVARYKSVRNMPGSFDAVSMMLETSIGCWQCSPRITKRPGSSKQRVFATDLTFLFAEGVEGRLTGLLQPLGRAS